MTGQRAKTGWRCGGAASPAVLKATTRGRPDAQAAAIAALDDARFLDKQYTVWGKVIEGMENVDKIKRGEPVSQPDKIIKASMGA